MSQAEAPEAPEVPAVHYSPDGRWRWDGSAWVPADAGYGSVSPDGGWWWDGTRWVPMRMAPASRLPLKSGRGRALFLCGCLALLAVVMVAGIINDLWIESRFFSLEAGEHLSAGDLHVYATVSNFTQFSFIVLALLILVALSLWLYRVGANLASLGASELRFSALVGALFVFLPLANLVLVLLVVREIYKATEPGLTQNDRATRAGVPVWRGVWVGWVALALALILAAVSLGFSILFGQPIDAAIGLDASLWFSILVQSCYLVCSVAGILVVLGIDWRQRERYSRLAAS